MTTIKPAHCKLCGEQHWSYEPHKYPASLQPRAMVKEFVRSQPSPAPIAKPRTKPVTAPRDSEQRKKNPNTCPGCNMPLPASRTKPRKYHDDACRMKVSRSKR